MKGGSSARISIANALRGRLTPSTGNALLFVLAALLALVMLPGRLRLDLERSKAPQHAGAASQSILAYNALMAPLLFPQLYPECGRVVLPPPPADATMVEYSKSQHGEDKVLHEQFFKNYTSPGVFLEIGALDGVTYF